MVICLVQFANVSVGLCMILSRLRYGQKLLISNGVSCIILVHAIILLPILRVSYGTGSTRVVWYLVWYGTGFRDRFQSLKTVWGPHRFLKPVPSFWYAFLTVS
jgi:hypothetical protein